MIVKFFVYKNLGRDGSTDFCLQPCHRSRTASSLEKGEAGVFTNDFLLPPRIRWKIVRRWGFGSSERGCIPNGELFLSVATPAEPRGEKTLFFVQILGGEKLLKFGEKRR